MKIIVFAAAVAGLLVSAGLANAQPVLPGTVRIVTLAQPGGSLDLLAQTIAQGLPELTGQTAVVDHKPGATGSIAMVEIARSKPDGSTIGLIINATHGVNGALFGKLPYDPIEDFTAISLLAVPKYVLLVNPTLPISNVPDLVAYARANPGKLSFATTGSGSGLHIAGELFNLTTGIKMIPVAYRGTAPALQMVMSNEAQVMFVPVPESIEFLKSGRLRALAISSKERSQSLPDLQSVADQGFPQFDFSTWMAIVGPKGMPSGVVDRYNEAISRIMVKPDVVKRLTDVGMEIKTSTAKELSEMIQAEVSKWPPLIKAMGITVQ